MGDGFLTQCVVIAYLLNPVEGSGECGNLP